jgi:hypothetical protein
VKPYVQKDGMLFLVPPVAGLLECVEHVCLGRGSGVMTVYGGSVLGGTVHRPPEALVLLIANHGGYQTEDAKEKANPRVLVPDAAALSEVTHNGTRKGKA